MTTDERVLAEADAAWNALEEDMAEALYHGWYTAGEIAEGLVSKHRPLIEAALQRDVLET